jgi:integrase
MVMFIEDWPQGDRQYTISRDFSAMPKGAFLTTRFSLTLCQALSREPGMPMHKRGLKSVSSLALRFLISTAARTGEVIGAAWSEIDLEAAAWTIPGSRMKAGENIGSPCPGPP